MMNKAETTRVTLKYVATEAPDLLALGPALTFACATGGLPVRNMRRVVHGLYLDLDDIAVTVTRCPDRPGELRIVAMSGDEGSTGSPLARRRFGVCAALARAVVAEAQPRRIEWRHRGGVYITEGGKVAVVSGMRGTSGEGARRKAAARAFTLYGHDRGTARRPAPARVDFHIGGRSSQTVPVRLAQYAINTTVCVLNLPLGAAVMTYQLLRGGSLAGSARWMAVAGTATAVASPGALQALIALV